MASLEQANAILERQRAELSSGEELEREASRWRGISPEQCWEVVVELCKDTDHYLGLLTSEQLERALIPDPLPEEALRYLECLRSQ